MNKTENKIKMGKTAKNKKKLKKNKKHTNKKIKK